MTTLVKNMARLGEGWIMAGNEQNLDSLLERSFSTDVPLLLKAREDAKRRVKDDPSAANLAALKSANQMLGDAMGSQNGNRNFPDVKQVLAYLHSKGRKIASSTLYRDINNGLLRKQPDKSFRQRDVDRYATMLQLVSMPEAKADENADLAREKMQEDIAKTREQRLSIIFAREKESGKYILREDVALELASRAATLALGLRSVFRLNVADYIRFVGGDVNKSEELAQMFEKNLDMALNEYSKPMDFALTLTTEEVRGSDSSDKVEYAPAESGEIAAKTEESSSGEESGSEQ